MTFGESEQSITDKRTLNLLYKTKKFDNISF